MIIVVVMMEEEKEEKEEKQEKQEQEQEEKQEEEREYRRLDGRFKQRMGMTRKCKLSLMPLPFLHLRRT